jgi:hypothetical protein
MTAIEEFHRLLPMIKQGTLPIKDLMRIYSATTQDERKKVS